MLPGLLVLRLLMMMILERKVKKGEICKMVKD